MYFKTITTILFLFNMANSSAQKDLAQIQFIKTLEVEVVKNPQNGEAREKLAQYYFRDKAYSKVIETLKGQLLDISDHSLSRLATSYKKTGMVNQEIQALSQLSKLRPKSYKPLLALGNAQLKLIKKPEEGRALRRSDIKFNRDTEEKAIRYFRKSVALSRNKQPPYDRLLAFFLEQNEHFEAQRLLEAMIQKFGKKGVFYSHLCRLFSVQAFLEQSVKTCTKAIKKDKKYPDNHVYLANTYYDMGNKTKAIKILLKASKKFPRSYFVHSILGKNYTEQENHLLATKHYQIATSLKPDSSEAIIGLAESLFHIEKYSEALPYYKKACSMNRSYKIRLRVATNTLKKIGKYRFVPRYMDEITACR